MALTLNSVKTEAIVIDGQQYIPEITVERRLRLAKASSKDGMGEEMLDIIADCFGDRKDEVMEKIKHFSVTSLCELQVYLLDGEEGVARFRGTLDGNKKEKADA